MAYLYPSQDDLRTSELVQPWIDEHFLRSDPFAFKDASFREIKSKICTEFEVDPNGVFCTGSGAMGLSLNPAKMQGSSLKSFDNESDLDIAVISDYHFQQAWRDLRLAAQPSLEPTSALISTHLSWQKKRFFDGAVLTNKLLPVLSFSQQWLTAQVRISEAIAVMLNREVSVDYWVFRDYWSLRNYATESALKCKRNMALVTFSWAA